MTGDPARPSVRQLRVVVAVDDFDDALAFYRETFGLTEQEAYEADGGARVVILGAGRATLELANAAQKRMIDDVEVGRQVAPHIRLAFEVDDSASATQRLADGGAALVAPPTETPWRSLNARLDAPGDLHITLFQELGDETATPDGMRALVDQVVDAAVANADAGQLPFAAVVVRDGEVVGAGVNTTLATGDPTAHAETEAVRAASRELGGDLSGAFVVSSCEPCAMCHAVCVAAGIDRVYFVAARGLVPDLGGPVRLAMPALQDAARSATPSYTWQVPSPRASEPFDRFVDLQRGRDGA